MTTMGDAPTEAEAPLVPRPRPSRPRLKDVAEAAGVSIQTVSNVLNGRRGFTEATGERVLAVIDEMGFRPNRAAASLRNQRHGQIAFDLSGSQLDPHSPVHIEFLRTVVLAAASHDSRVVVLSPPRDAPPTWTPTAPAHALHEFRAFAELRDVDGFVLSDSHPGDPRVDILSELDIPFAVFGRTRADRPQRWVDVDNTGAINSIVDHLVSRGHERFAYIGYPDDFFWTVERREAAAQRLRSHGLSLPKPNLLASFADDIPATVSKLLRRSSRPSAIITGSDSLALPTVVELRAHGISVGDEIAVTGFDGGPMQQLLMPELTTVTTPVQEIADLLVDMLTSVVKGVEHVEGTLLPAPLVVGSTG